MTRSQQLKPKIKQFTVGFGNFVWECNLKRQYSKDLNIDFF